MDIFKTFLWFVGYDEDHSYLVDTIFHEGHWWLVASWLQHHATGERIPERIVRMDGVFVRFQEVNEPRYRFLLNNAMPKSVFDGKAQDGYVVATHPLALLKTQGPKSKH